MSFFYGNLIEKESEVLTIRFVIERGMAWLGVVRKKETREI